MTRQFQLHADPVHQRPDGRAAGLDHIVGGLAVTGLALRLQFAQFAQRVHPLQKRSLGVVPQPPRQLLGGAAQVKAKALAVQASPVLGSQHDATAGGQHARARVLQRIPEHLGFDVPKRFLARLGEEALDRHADAPLDQRIGVLTAPAVVARHQARHAGLAAAGQAHQADDHGLSVLCRRHRAPVAEESSNIN